MSGKSRRVYFSYVIVSSQVCDVRYSTKLQVFQCAQGHFVCGDCRAKLDPDFCPTCRGVITGRAVDFEKFLQGLLMDSE